MYVYIYIYIHNCPIVVSLRPLHHHVRHGQTVLDIHFRSLNRIFWWLNGYFVHGAIIMFNSHFIEQYVYIQYHCCYQLASARAHLLSVLNSSCMCFVVPKQDSGPKNGVTTKISNQQPSFPNFGSMVYAPPRPPFCKECVGLRQVASFIHIGLRLVPRCWFHNIWFYNVLQLIYMKVGSHSSKNCWVCGYIIISIAIYNVFLINICPVISHVSGGCLKKHSYGPQQL